jgi:hypothetical protein
LLVATLVIVAVALKAPELVQYTLAGVLAVLAGLHRPED